MIKDTIKWGLYGGLVVGSSYVLGRLHGREEIRNQVKEILDSYSFEYEAEEK